MGRNGKPTRDKILNESKELIYENGFAGTSVDQILDRTGITKGAFFYHFNTKAELAKVLMNDFAKADLEELDKVLSQTEHITNPKERLLTFIQSFVDMFSGIEEPPNCLYASVSNEQNQYSEDIKSVVKETILKWRMAFEKLIDEILKTSKARKKVEKNALADHFTVVLEGAFIMSKALSDPSIAAKQLTQVKNYVDLLFE